MLFAYSYILGCIVVTAIKGIKSIYAPMVSLAFSFFSGDFFGVK